MTEEQLIAELDKLKIPTDTDGMIAFLGWELQQITQTNKSGWFAYASSHLPGITTRSQGDTMRLALLNVCYALAIGKEQMPEIPMGIGAEPEPEPEHGD